MISDSFVLGLCAIGMFIHSDSVFFRSDSLLKVNLRAAGGHYFILDDSGHQVDVTALEDSKGVAYWHRRIKTEVCQTGECKLVDIGLYWDCTGDFFGLEVFGEHLTKTDHSIFLSEDYDRLISILSNDWSILREYDFSDLTMSVNTLPGNNKEVDATSGATRKEIASEAVKDAVYTTYTLWHLVHGGENEQLEELTVKRLNDESCVQALLAASVEKYDYFLLSLLVESKIRQFESLNRLVLRALELKSDPLLRDLAVKSLAREDVNAASFQNEVASVYERSTLAIRLQMLTALKETKQVHARLRSALEADLTVENEWLALKILPVLMKAQEISDETLETVRELTKSNNSQLKARADEFLKVVD